MRLAEAHLEAGRTDEAERILAQVVPEKSPDSQLQFGSLQARMASRRGDQTQATHLYAGPLSTSIHVTAYDEDSPITGYTVSQNVQVLDVLPAPTVTGNPAGVARSPEPPRLRPRAEQRDP